MKKLLPLIAMLASLSVLAQKNAKYDFGQYYYGFKGGVTYHQVEDIKATIIPPFFNEETFNTSIEPQLGYVGGIFFYHRFAASSLAIQPEITYGNLNSSFAYNDVDDLEYTIDFNYEYLHLGTYLKLYPFSKNEGGFHIAAGPQLSFNLSNEKIIYDSNRPDIGPNLQIQQNLRDVLKGETLFGIGLGVGYEFGFGLNIEARYYLGLSDAIETQANGYFFTENDNRTQSLNVTVGYAIPFATYNY